MNSAASLLQRHLDDAWKARDELVLRPGYHNLYEHLTARCSVRGLGGCDLVWKGERTERPMLTLLGTSGTLYTPNVRNLNFHCENKAPGMLVDDVHRATISDVNFFQPYKMAMEVRRGWTVHVQDVAATAGEHSRGFVFHQTGGSVEGVVVCKLVGDGPLIQVGGVTAVRQLCVENCDSGDSPAILLEKFRCEFSGLHTESLRCRTIVEVRDSHGASIRHLHCWQGNRPQDPEAECVLSLLNCVDTQVEQIDAANITDRLLRIDDDCDGIRWWGVRERLQENGKPFPKRPRYPVQRNGSYQKP